MELCLSFAAKMGIIGFIKKGLWLPLLMVAITLSAQNGYRLVKVLKNFDQTETLNPCYLPRLLDSSAHGETRLIAKGGGKFDLLYLPDSNFVGTDTVIVEARSTNDQSYKLLWYSFVFCYVNSYLKTEQDFYAVAMNSGQTTVYPLSNDSTSIPGNNKIQIHQIANAQKLSSVSFTDSTVSFTPMADSSGKASISYRVCDVLGMCETNQIYINIVDNAALGDDTLKISTAENQSIHVALPSAAYQLTSNPKKGNVSFNGASFVYTPHKNINGRDTFLLEDGSNSTLVYARIYDLPAPNSIINSDEVVTPVNQLVNFNVTLNDLVPIVSQFPVLIHDTTGLKGTLERLDTDGNFRFTPQTDYQGVQSFTYKVCPRGNCEYARVHLLIGDFEPMTNHEYQFKTKRNTPIVLNYAVPIDGYDFSSSSNQISFYPGWDTITINYNNGCSSTVIGYNTLIYTPLLNTIGVEDFTIEYCINSTGRCVTADIVVETEYEAKNCNKQCVGDCVWPGDLDLNGQVNMKDLLHLAYEMGKTGPARTYQGLDYRSYKANNWGQTLSNSSIDIKHADCNGNGVINETDALAIDQSYHKEHALIPNETAPKSEFPFELVNLTPNAGIGDLAAFEVRLGTDQYPVIGLSGYSYILDYNKDVLEDSTLLVHFYNDSWFSHNANTVNLHKVPWEGRIESGFARVGGNIASGEGGTELITFIIVDDLDPFRREDEFLRIPFYFTGMQKLNADGSLEALEDYTYIWERRIEKDKRAVLDASQLLLFPNPAKGQALMHLNGLNTMTSYSIWNIEGIQLRLKNNVNPKHEMIDLSELTDGMYIIKVETALGTLVKKLIVRN